jgi:ribonucleoside-triphosphate reductase
MSKLFEDFVAISRYCRWIPELQRRETWDEAVDRYINYLISRFNITEESRLDTIETCRDYMKNREIFGSMRALMTAGPALDVDDVAAYNCSYVAIERPSDFRNIMYILMCGTGVGFSCESQFVNKLPDVPSEIRKTEDKIVVEDSRAGWADGFHKFIHSLYSGHHPYVDLSKVRPAGARLKTFGGRASGPEPFERLIRFTANMFHKAKGRKLKPIEVHDLVCQVAEIVICGGVRRSALISLSDLSNREMALCKSGAWWETSGHRSLANNSAVYESKPALSEFLQEWCALYDSHSGERGICNRKAMETIARKAGRRVEGHKFGTNPCSEIILRSKQFCNLSTVVAKYEDTPEELRRKITLATVLGTLQSNLVNFTFFEERGDYTFHQNCSEERLLGVSITGIMDAHKLFRVHSNLLSEMKKLAHEVNRDWAEYLGINPSASITCVKPEGTTSCVAGSSSGMHPRYSKYYIRRVRLDSKDPIGKLMKDANIPWEPCVMRPDSTLVFSFPIKSPNGALTQDDVNAILHLKWWKAWQEDYCDHKPSITVSYTDDEFLEVGQWVWNNWDILSGISFLPKEDHVYQQAPFEAITQEQYETMVKDFPTEVNWSLLSMYELEDETKHNHTLSCSASGCEVT